MCSLENCDGGDDGHLATLGQIIQATFCQYTFRQNIWRQEIPVVFHMHSQLYYISRNNCSQMVLLYLSLYGGDNCTTIYSWDLQLIWHDWDSCTNINLKDRLRYRQDCPNLCLFRFESSRTGSLSEGTVLSEVIWSFPADVTCIGHLSSANWTNAIPLHWVIGVH